jgi:hypothetical protein
MCAWFNFCSQGNSHHVDERQRLKEEFTVGTKGGAKGRRRYRGGEEAGRLLAASAPSRPQFSALSLPIWAYSRMSQSFPISARVHSPLTAAKVAGGISEWKDRYPGRQVATYQQTWQENGTL